MVVQRLLHLFVRQQDVASRICRLSLVRLQCQWHGAPGAVNLGKLALNLQLVLCSHHKLVHFIWESVKLHREDSIQGHLLDVEVFRFHAGQRHQLFPVRLPDGVALQLLDQRNSSLEGCHHLLQLLEGGQLSELFLLLGHAPDLLVEILRALGQGIDVELGPQGVAELVDHGAVVDVDLVDLLQKPEVLLKLQQLWVRLDRQVEQGLRLHQVLTLPLELLDIDVILLHQFHSFLQRYIGPRAFPLEDLQQLLALRGEVPHLLLRDL
mmetsp:Transcript_82349/g.197496  ORF Transcript_82349/g.197496 Transcript_82349/m.197496 type:complete len:266 (-) Transcript_82349:4015-4812(-)